MAQPIKRGDEVVILSGESKGKRAKVLRILRDEDRVIVEGIAMIKRHSKPRSDKDRGGIIEREAPIHRSKIMLSSRYDARRAKRPAAAKA